LSCIKCGKPIWRGQYCVLCQSEIVGGLRDAGRRQTMEEKEEERETFLERYRKRKKKT
jgi:hypothetical protein